MRTLSICSLLLGSICLLSNPKPTESAERILLNFNETGAIGTTWPGWTWINGFDTNPHISPAKGSDGFGDYGWNGNSGYLMSGNWYPRTEAKQDTGNKSLAIIDPGVRAPGTNSGASMKVYDTPAGTVTTGSVTTGSNIVTIANPTGYAVGDNIRMPSVPSYNYPSSAWFPQISAITGNQLTIVRSDTKAAYNADATVTNSVFRPLYLSGWWYNSGVNYNTIGMADATTNRMSIYVKVTGLDPIPDPSTDLDNMNFYIGTYLCWPGGAIGGEDCPKEANAVSSNHYYHYFTFNSGGWTHLLLDRSPQHNRGDAGTHIGPPDQRFVADGIHHYFQYMNNFYAQVSYPQLNPTSFWIDEIKLFTAAQPENEVSVTSLFVSFWPKSNTWELGFNDNSWSDNVGNNSVSTHEIRYSASPITNENYDSATPITPILNGKTGANAGTGRIKRPNPWKFSALTRFMLPTSFLQSTNTVYFAVKDVSSLAKGDGHDAPNSLIKTIDYYIIKAPNSLI